ncbi:MAG: FecR family protein, partial [Rhodospirillales bacterium]
LGQRPGIKSYEFCTGIQYFRNARHSNRRDLGLKGTVNVTRADGTQVELNTDDTLYQGDVLETGADGSVGLIFVDDTVFSMGQNAEISLNEMVFDASSNEGSMAFSIAKGVFTFVSGQIAKSGIDQMSLDSPVGVIGIRGTDGGIDLGDGSKLTVVLRPEDGSGQIGEIVLTNDDGVVVLNQAYQAANIEGPGFAPTQPFTMTLGQYAQSFGDTLAMRPTAPHLGQPKKLVDTKIDSDQENEAEDLSSGTDKGNESNEEGEQFNNADFVSSEEFFAFTNGNGAEKNAKADNDPFGDDGSDSEGPGNSNGNGNSGNNGNGNENGNNGNNGNGNNGNGNGNSGDTTHNVSGTETVTLTASADDDVNGSSGADTITFSGSAESGDTVDLGAGTDSLTLD